MGAMLNPVIPRLQHKGAKTGKRHLSPLFNIQWEEGMDIHMVSEPKFQLHSEESGQVKEITQEPVIGGHKVPEIQIETWKEGVDSILAPTHTQISHLNFH